MLQRRIWWAFLLVLAVGIAVSARIVTLGNSVQAVNRMFIAEKLPLSQHIGELRGVIADEERLLYEYYSYTATRNAFHAQRQSNKRAGYSLKVKVNVFWNLLCFGTKKEKRGYNSGICLFLRK